MKKTLFWTDRSVAYACRSLSSLNKGEHYDKVLPVVQVGFLSYTLFPEHPEFCANYQLVNVSQKENPYVFSDKLRICVVNLSRIDLATEQDKASGIDLWARVFTATTWEEINMLTQDNIYLQEVVSGVQQLTEEEKIRQQCQAREDYAYWERIREADRKRELQKKDNIINEQADTINEQADTIIAQEQKLSEQNAEINRLRAEIAALKNKAN